MLSTFFIWEADADTVDPPWGQTKYDNQKRSELSFDVVEEEEEGSEVVAALWIAIGASSAVLLTCVLIYLLLRFKVIQKWRNMLMPRREEHPLTLTTNGSAVPTPHGHVPEEWLSGGCGVGTTTGGGFVHLGFVPTEQDEDWRSKLLNRLQTVRTLPRAQVQLPFDLDEEHVDKVIGQGKYGPVYESSWQEMALTVFRISSPMNKGVDSGCARELSAFLALAAHPNVINLVGFFEEDPWLYLALQGDEKCLKSQLLEARKGLASSRALIMCAMGVAEALFHLQTHQMTHGKLCGWNVLVPTSGAEGTDFSQPKLTGFGPFTLHSSTKDLSRWMSAEQFDNRCAPPSDNWAFGILLWEICNLGATPYHEVRPEDLKKRVERGARPGQSEHVSDDLYQIMLHCWQLDKHERPHPSDLACQLHQLLPHSNEHLFISQSLKYSPYIEEYEHEK